MVEGHAGDPSKVTASGPGLQPTGNVINRPTYFDVFTKDAGRGVPEVIVLDPQVFTIYVLLKIFSLKYYSTIFFICLALPNISAVSEKHDTNKITSNIPRCLAMRIRVTCDWFAFRKCLLCWQTHTRKSYGC